MYVPTVLQQYCKLKEQMESKEFYSALKTLEQLEHTSLPQVKGYGLQQKSQFFNFFLSPSQVYIL